MIPKILSAIVAIVLVVGFLSPVIFKLKETPLFVVVGLGIGLMLWDMWGSLREKDK